MFQLLLAEVQVVMQIAVGFIREAAVQVDIEM
jgi:hypothetical protein